MRKVGSQISPLFDVRLCSTARLKWTYSSQKHGYGSKDSKNEESRNKFGRVLRICLEDMVDLLALSIAERLLVGRGRSVGVELYMEAKDVASEGLG